MLFRRSEAPLLALVGFLSIASLAFLGDRDNRWLWWGIRAAGATAAVSAVIAYSKEDDQPEPEPETDLQSASEALAELAEELELAYQLRVEQLAAEHKEQVEELKLKLAQAREEIEEKVRAEYQPYWEELDDRKTRLQQQEQLQEEWLQDQLEQLKQEKQELEQRYEQRLDKAQAELDQAKADLLASLEEAWDRRKQQAERAIADAHAEIEMRDRIISELRQRLREAKYREPSAEYGHAGWIAHLVQQSLASHDILTSFENCALYPDGSVKVWLDLVETSKGEAVKVKSVQDRLADIEKKVGLGKCTLTIAGDKCQFVFDGSQTNPTATVKTKSGRTVQLEQPDGDWLRSFIERSERLSAFISGDSGSGKSTLVNNYINLVRTVMAENGEPVEVILIDGKDPDSPWFLDGREVIPQYGGINDPDDPDGELNWVENDSLSGILAMKDDVYQRLRSKRKARDQKKAFPKFPKRIYVIDECEEIVSIHGKQASKPILSAARLGRSSGVAVIVVGQTANCSGYGFQIPNLKNFCRFYLRENAILGIEQNVSTAMQKRPLLAQVGAREAQSEGLMDGDPRKYWGFVKNF